MCEEGLRLGTLQILCMQLSSGAPVPNQTYVMQLSAVVSGAAAELSLLISDQVSETIEWARPPQAIYDGESQMHRAHFHTDYG